MTLIESDVVVIGSGVAGAITACKLARAGARVTILEAGPRVTRAAVVRGFMDTHKLDMSGGFPNPDHAPRPDWTNPDEDIIRFTGRKTSRAEYLRVVGGTTWHWGAVTPRYTGADFRMRSRYGVGVDWPISYAELEPFYAEAEREMGVAGDPSEHPGQEFPLPPFPLGHSDRIMRAALAKTGMHFISNPVARNTRPYGGRGQCQGFGTCSPICPSGAQYAAINHVEAAERLGVRVLENTRVERLRTGSDGRITALEAARPDRSRIEARAQVYVVAANGFESPRLLMMSADARHPDGLANRSGQLGRNYMDHLEVKSVVQMPVDVYPGRGPINILANYDFRDGDFRSERPAYILSVYNNEKLDQIANELLSRGVEPPALDRKIRARLLRTIEIGTSLEQLPDPTNRMTLDRERRDRAGQPVMRLHYGYSAYEEAGFGHVQGELRRITAAMGGTITEEIGPKNYDHPMGMTRMGSDPRESVVNPYCRAHDHNNLYVVSGSVFPTGGTGNPTLTIAALALRAAHAIDSQLRTRDA